MASKRDVHSYFSTKENESKRSKISIPEIIVTATNNANQAEVDTAKEQVKKESAKRRKCQNVPEKARKEVGRYAGQNL